MKSQRNAYQKDNTAQIEWIPRDREDPFGNDLVCGMPRICWLNMACKFPSGKNDKTHPNHNENDTCSYEGYREETTWKGDWDNQLQCDRYQKRNAKDHLKDLPPTIVRNISCHLLNPSHLDFFQRKGKKRFALTIQGHLHQLLTSLTSFHDQYPPH
jgi:hypothetical protein